MYVHVKQGNRVQLFACIGVVEFLVVFRFFRIGGSLGHKVAYTAGPQTVSHHPGNQNIRWWWTFLGQRAILGYEQTWLIHGRSVLARNSVPLRCLACVTWVFSMEDLLMHSWAMPTMSLDSGALLRMSLARSQSSAKKHWKSLRFSDSFFSFATTAILTCSASYWGIWFSCMNLAEAETIPYAGRTGSRLRCGAQVDFEVLVRSHPGWCSILIHAYFDRLYCSLSGIETIWNNIRSIDTEADEDRDYFAILKYTATCGDAWFRSLYQHGVWIPASAASAMIPLAWGLTEPCPCLS